MFADYPRPRPAVCTKIASMSIAVIVLGAQSPSDGMNPVLLGACHKCDRLSAPASISRSGPRKPPDSRETRVISTGTSAARRRLGGFTSTQ